eukprot:271562-Rhodomonas_salina.1
MSLRCCAVCGAERAVQGVVQSLHESKHRAVLSQRMLLRNERMLLRNVRYLGSLEDGAQLYPRSKPLSAETIRTSEAWVGTPATLACVETLSSEWAASPSAFRVSQLVPPPSSERRTSDRRCRRRRGLPLSRVQSGSAKTVRARLT